MTQSQIDEAKRLAEESVDAIVGHGSIPISTYRLNEISKATIHLYKENERLRECVVGVQKLVESAMCPEEMQEIKDWLKKYSDLTEGKDE